MGQPTHSTGTQAPRFPQVMLGGVVAQDVTQPGLFAGVGGVGVPAGD